MKPGKPLERKTRLQADPEKTAAWRARSRKRLPAESPKRKAERPVRAEVRQVVLERDQGCTARGLLPGRCWHPYGEPLDVHEVTARGTHPGSHLNPDAAVAVCRGHHQWIGNHPAEAEEAGFRVRFTTGVDEEGDQAPY